MKKLFGIIALTVSTMANPAIAFDDGLTLGSPAMPPLQKCAGFDDVLEDNPFCADILWLKHTGITRGCGNGNFCPDQPLTRRQMAAFMHRFFGALECKITTAHEGGEDDAQDAGGVKCTIEVRPVGGNP